MSIEADIADILKRQVPDAILRRLLVVPVVATAPGEVTVRLPDGLRAIPKLAGWPIAPLRQAIVLQIGRDCYALGEATVPGEAEAPLPIPYGSRGGRYGTEDAVARVDHSHGPESVVPVAQTWANLAAFTTTNTTTYTDATIGTQVVTLPPGVWAYNLYAEATMWRSVGSGGMFLRLDVVPAVAGAIVRTQERNIPVSLASEKQAVRVPHVVSQTISYPEGGDVNVSVLARGDGTAGTTSAQMVALTGFFWRVG